MTPHKCRRFEGKVALVTASTQGIGLAIVRRLAEEGAEVVICSRKQKAVDERVAEFAKEGLKVSGIACHVGDEKQLEKLVEFVKEKHGRLDVLVSNAAVNPTSGAIADVSSDAMDKIMAINVKSALLLVQKALPLLGEGSSIVFISSYTAYAPPFPISYYGVSKTALLGLTKALANELGPCQIRVNAVCPGIVPTKFAGALVATESLREKVVEPFILKRLGRAEDMAAGVAFLASDDASYITGESLIIAGGANCRL